MLATSPGKRIETISTFACLDLYKLKNETNHETLIQFFISNMCHIDRHFGGLF
ncbi:hypothetical protein QWZ13_06575 [Reinekea marina]|uniref:hypothetical protein n=1 Tax=Reinekea marina TaxID=1310421 RepID=UPI0025B52F1D|nr:hypothetical protein [Reinekea marina]MDN3648574.1 hypothetical protein [Reinekea marina]